MTWMLSTESDAKTTTFSSKKLLKFDSKFVAITGYLFLTKLGIMCLQPELNCSLCLNFKYTYIYYCSDLLLIIFYFLFSIS